MKDPKPAITPIPAAKRPLALMAAEHYTRSYMLWVPEGTIVEQVCEPEFWANVTKKMTRGDKIEVMPNDMTWRAMLIVRAVGRLEAVVQVLQYDVLGAAGDVDNDSPYIVKFVNTDRKWGVFMRAGGALVRDEFQVREHADRYVVNHTKVMAA